ncbi:hypothetical protein M0R45_010182 [Rubus argutus]|uniref:Uncharacterized protein n=1 Tax=Rubus argutus TaxID=59490 RepID=A0AAW1Y6V9_RUBAR
MPHRRQRPVASHHHGDPTSLLSRLPSPLNHLHRFLSQAPSRHRLLPCSSFQFSLSCPSLLQSPLTFNPASIQELLELSGAIAILLISSIPPLFQAAPLLSIDAIVDPNNTDRIARSAPSPASPFCPTFMPCPATPRAHALLYHRRTTDPSTVASLSRRYPAHAHRNSLSLS